MSSFYEHRRFPLCPVHRENHAAIIQFVLHELPFILRQRGLEEMFSGSGYLGQRVEDYLVHHPHTQHTVDEVCCPGCGFRQIDDPVFLPAPFCQHGYGILRGDFEISFFTDSFDSVGIRSSGRFQL